jgi:hypothetical protein
VTLTVTGGGGIDPSALVSAVTAINAALLDGLQECFHWAPGTVALMKAEGAAFAGVLGEAQVAGRVTYSPSDADPCAAAVTAATCLELDAWAWDLPDTCAPVVAGAVANGNPCFSGIECAGGYCDSDLTATCPGTCTALVANDGACTDRIQCASGACDGASCVPDVPGAEGEPCGFGLFACQAGLYCISGTCEQRLGADAPCSQHEECAFGLGCAEDGTCHAWAGAGEDCTAATCGQGFYCSADGGNTCAEWPMLGDACAELGPGQPCFDGSYCSSGLTCVAGTVPVAGDCDHTNDQFCAPGAFCSDILGPGTCEALPAGEACY